jgi:hypothetical protein
MGPDAIVALGAVVGIFVWLGSVTAVRLGAGTDRRLRTHDEIRLRAILVGNRVAASWRPEDSQISPMVISAKLDVEALLRQISAALEDPRRMNVSNGTDMVGLWRMLHRAEEALLMLAPTQDVVAEALTDRQRLLGSTIPNAESLASLQAAALDSIAPEWRGVFARSTNTARPEKGSF